MCLVGLHRQITAGIDFLTAAESAILNGPASTPVIDQRFKILGFVIVLS